MAAAAESFDLLLQRLGQGGEGALGYERLRNRLVAFFRLRFPAQAEALADDVLDRLARRLAEGTVVDSPRGVCARHRPVGVAGRKPPPTEAAAARRLKPCAMR